MRRNLTSAGLLLLLVLPSVTFAAGPHGQGGGHSQGSPHGGQGQGLFGTVTNLQTTAAGVSFTLYGDAQHSLTVTTTSATAITDHATGAAATLFNGVQVKVKGTLDTTGTTLASTVILVDDSVRGSVSSLQITGTGFTFDLTDPAGQKITVSTGSTTLILSGSTGTATALAEGQRVCVFGTYDLTTKVYTAIKIIVQDRVPVAGGFGTIANLLTTNGVSTFTLQGEHGNSVNVVTTAATKISSFSDNSTAALANGQNVCVKGNYDSATQILTATSIVVNDRQPPHSGAFAEGSVGSVDTTAGTLSLTVKKSSFTPTSTAITVTLLSTTIIRDSRGRKINLASVTVGANAKAEGTFDATTQTLTALEVHLIR